MRATVLSVVMLVGVLAGPAWAQDDYTEFTSAEDRFTVTFPGTPTLTTGFWLTEYGVTLPAKFYTVTDIAGRHTLTVVDYTPVERTLVEKSYNCPLGAETCSGIADTGLGYWKNDFRGATTYAIERLITNRNVTVTHLMFNFMQLVAGKEVQFTNNADQSRTFAAAYMHANRLLIAESTVKKGFPPPTILQQSFGWLDETGTKNIRYQYLYSNEPDHRVAPTPVRPQVN